MVDDKLRIHLLIDNQRYPLHIKRDEEYQYREAAKQIDNKLNKYRSLWPNLQNEQYWAMAALDLAFENLSLKGRNDTKPYLEKLKQLQEDIDDCIKNREQKESV